MNKGVTLSYKSLIFEAMFLFVPKVFVRHCHDPKWFNSEIRHHLKCLRSMRKKYKLHPTPQRRVKINSSEILLQCKMEQAKVAYETNLIESHQTHSSTTIYSYIRSMSGLNALLSSIMHLHNIAAATDNEKAYLFNQYFHSVFTDSSFTLPPFSELNHPHQFISHISISELDVFKALKALDVSKAMGCDGISPKLLKHCAIALYQPLYHLFSLSISQFYIPKEWRTHLIKPIFKAP